MSLIIKQLAIQKIIYDEKSWETAHFAKLAENAWLWRIQYQALCAQLIAEINQSNADDKTTAEHIKSALFMAELLEALHERLNELPTSEQFKQDKYRLKQLLQCPADAPTLDASNYSGVIQALTFPSDTARLLSINTLRIGRTVKTFGYHVAPLEHLIDYFSPLLSFAGFLVYLPRSIMNSIVMSSRYSEKQAIPLKSRFQAHAEINDRLFNLINDFPSVLSGFVSIFLLTAGSAWLAAYFTVAVKCCEIICSAIRKAYDVSRLYAMRATYDQHKNLTSADRKYLKYLDDQIAYIKGTRQVNTAMHTLLVFCLMCFTPPIMMLHPVIPLLAAIFAISLVCLRFSKFRDIWISTPPPQNNLQSLSFFQQPALDNKAAPWLNQSQPNLETEPQI